MTFIRKVVKTLDGSTTLQIDQWGERYHSFYGAIKESYHVFIKNGFQTCNLKELSILEIGLGTGLNALLTYDTALNEEKNVNYVGVDAYPISYKEVEAMNYLKILSKPELIKPYYKMHYVSWEKTHQIHPLFKLTKQKKKFQIIESKKLYDLIYFDAFSARVQPELWTEVIFKRMFQALKENGILVTYSSKGSVYRAIKSVGFTAERLPGPPGKREMLRAYKK